MDGHDIALRLFCAVIAGAIIGIHFEIRERPGGLRTHMLATFGAALFCVIGARVTEGHGYEAVRVVQGVISGIGFIGAATVLRREGGVTGITTAASIWVSAAVGCAAGFGEYILALVLAPLVAFLSIAGLHIEKRWLPRGKQDPSSERPGPPSRQAEVRE
jgi:putative Mg2+ transporter-C (MgtC) family protein